MDNCQNRILANATPGIRIGAVAVLTLGLLGLAGSPAEAQLEVLPLDDMILDADALLMPRNATFGRSINGVAYQAQPLLTTNGYQYATWYHLGNNEDVYLARRDLTGTTWEVFDTGENFINGDGPAWDAHNIISMGVAGDGTIHLAWDHHGHTLRYMNTVTGVTTNPGSVTWDSSIMNAERSSLDIGGPSITGVTYPRFITANDGDMLVAYRTGGSGNGDMNIATYDAGSGLWDTPHKIIASTGNYTDALGTSTSRNGYTNGFDYGPDGTIHVTWTWRESAGGANHDINYAYSDDDGSTWRNNDGTVIGTPGSPISINSPGIIIDDGNAGNGLLGEMDRRNTLMNQQTQAVDLDGRVHTIMWHADDANRDSVSGFTTTPAAYFHYFRDPVSGDWTRRELPTDRAVGSRPQVAYDADGNLYVIYVSAGPGDGVGVLNYYTDGDLVIAGATKASNYTDWSILHTDTRDFAGEPLLDQQRLLDDGVLSIFLQENDDLNTGAVGTPLHVLDFNVGAVLAWIGDDSGVWDTGVGTDWDSDIDGIGNAAFVSGRTVRFTDNAATSIINIVNPVTPGNMKFENNTKAFNFTGAGIGGTGSLSVTCGGNVTLSNSINTYTGDTNISNGTLILTGVATITASPNINVTDTGTLDVSGTASPFTLADGQTLNHNSSNAVVGEVVAGNGSSIAGAGTFQNNVTAQAGSVIRVGDAGMPKTTVSEFALIDDFDAPGLAEYDFAKVLDQGSTTNISFSDSGGTLNVTSTGADGAEQALFLRNDGVTLERGEEIVLDAPSAFNNRDLGIAIGQAATDLGDGNSGDNRNGADFVFMAWRTLNQLNSRGFNGNSEVSLQQELGITADRIFIARLENDDIELGWYDGGVRNVSWSTTPATLDIFSHVGFYADIRADGDGFTGADNFGKLVDALLVEGQVLTVQGDLILETGSTLELDVYSPAFVDKLDIGGHLTAAGTLAVTLDSAAPAPQLGDTFDILDFTTASGAFDTLTLPTLDAGLFWNTTNLLTTGILEVVDSLALEGDLNGDGFVGIADLNLVLGNWNQNVTPGDPLQGDPSGDGFVGIADLNVVLGNWNAGSPPSANTNIPEPATFTLLLGAILTTTRRTRVMESRAASTAER